jgi:DNA-nicking Smr family endonuclease
VSAPRRKFLTDTDRHEWAAYARTVLPLAGRSISELLPAIPETAPPPTPAPESRATEPRAKNPAAKSITVGDQPGGLDKNSWNKLRTGKLAPTRTLDLHGRTVQRAFHALHAFLLAAHADQVRCVEIITGRGSDEGGGAIRRELPIWLNLPALRPLVLAASYPHAANTGAVRLLLRRIR